MSAISRTALAAILSASAVAQAQHAGHHSGAAEPRGNAAIASQEAGGGDRYRSAFSEYRPFGADLPLRDWKRANDEVREAGGHLGVIKGASAGQQDHGAHGAQRKAPTAQPPVRK